MMAGVLLFSAPYAQAQKKALELKRVQAKRVGVPGGGQDRWLQITAQFATAPDWIDELEMDFYVLMEGKDDQDKFNLFNGKVTYVNVERGRHEGEMYVQPGVLNRFGSLKSVAVVVKARGQVVGIVSEPASGERWWERFSPKEGSVFHRYKTPFIMESNDDEPDIKLDK
jgi:hypothetical protein